MEKDKQESTVRVVTCAPITHVQTHVMSLLYLPIVGRDAHALYFALHGLSNRYGLKSCEYPKVFLLDLLSLAPDAFERACRTLEAAGLLETYEGPEGFLYELYLPLSPEAFFKDSPFAPYLQRAVGEERFLDLHAQFQIDSNKKKTGYTARTARFDEVFPPIEKQSGPGGELSEARTKKLNIQTTADVELVLAGIPKTLLADSMRTKQTKEKLKQTAYLYSLDEKHLGDLIKKSLTKNKTIDFSALSHHAKAHYRAARDKTSRKGPIQRKQEPHGLAYFKRVHPRTLLAETTGEEPPAADLRVIERLIEESGLPLEVINVLIAYVLKELDQQVPVYGYFEKIVAEWRRNQIETADAAIAHIRKKLQRRRSPRRPSGRGEKPFDTEVDWFKEYLKEQEE